MIQKETIDILYDTEFRLRQTGKPRKVNMTPAAMENVTVPTVTNMTGTKDVYFVFSGDVEFDSWSVK